MPLLQYTISFLLPACSLHKIRSTFHMNRLELHIFILQQITRICEIMGDNTDAIDDEKTYIRIFKYELEYT